MNIKEKSITHCGVCNSPSLDLLWELPHLPLTEKYGLFDPSQKLHWDQNLLICNQCGHVQLESQLPPEFLYTPSAYSFRTGESHSAKTGAQVFFNFYHKVCGGRGHSSLLDVGGNDLFLAKMVFLEKRSVIDPICAPQDGQVIDGIQVIGKFVEEVNFQKEGLFPDLIFCRHVLEHVAKPREMLQQLMAQCHPNATYIFEIPCFENLMEANRFDAIFHQHYHYFDLATFQRLICEAGGKYLDHFYNRQGPCGGALLIAFQRGKGREQPLSFDLGTRKKHIRSAIAHYQQQMQLLSEQLKKFNQNIYGYGASLMLATLSYHLRTDFSELICILDDDIKKDNIGYQNLPLRVRYSGNCRPEPNSNFIVTSLENTRSIFKRIMDFSPRRVLVPLIN